MTTRYPEIITTLPKVPKEFGDDGGKFYGCYDELAEEIDDDLVRSLKAQLDGSLIFAGLFAGVNSAFLVLTLPQMSANPANDTNALLLGVLLGGNSSIKSASDLPSASFTVPPRIYPINVLFSVSLTLALLSSFIAVLGQYWIVYYRKQGGGGPEHQRWEQLRRSLGAKRWRLELVLKDLVPSMLQLGLVLFCIAFSLYLSTSSKPLGCIVTSILCTAAIIILAMTTCAAFDPWCPFKTPLSRSIRPVASCFVALSVWFALIIFLLLLIVFAMAVSIFNRELAAFKMIYEILLNLQGYSILYRRLTRTATRSSDDPEYLKVEAIRRVMNISEDRSVLVHAAMNLQTIREHGPLSSLIEDKRFYSRLSRLGNTAVRQISSEQPNPTQSIEARALYASFVHLWLTAGSIPDIEGHLLPAFDRFWSIREHDEIEYQPESRKTSIPCAPSISDCSRCSHCTTLWFSMRFVSLLAERSYYDLEFLATFRKAEGALRKSADLRLGCVVASAILASNKFYEAFSVGPVLGGTKFRCSDALGKILVAYREQSNSRMIDLVFNGLATVKLNWMGQPDHGLYVRLFELGLSPELSDSTGTHAILTHLGTMLLSIETRIRNETTSEPDGQRGREHQNRCVQSVVENFKQRRRWNSDVWCYIGPPLELYLQGVKGQVEANPTHSKNPSTIDFLKRVNASFPTPELDNAPTQTADRRKYSQFRELLNQIELFFQTKNNSTYKEAVMQSTRSFDAYKQTVSSDSDAVGSMGTRNADKEAAGLNTPSDIWGN